MNQKLIIIVLCMIILGFFTLEGKSNKEFNLGLLGGYSILLNDTDFGLTGGISKEAIPTFSPRLYLNFQFSGRLAALLQVEILYLTMISHISRYGFEPGDYESHDSMTNVMLGLRYYAVRFGKGGQFFFQAGWGISNSSVSSYYSYRDKHILWAGSGLKLPLSGKLSAVTLVSLNYLYPVEGYNEIVYCTFHLGLEFKLTK